MRRTRELDDFTAIHKQQRCTYFLSRKTPQLRDRIAVREQLFAVSRDLLLELRALLILRARLVVEHDRADHHAFAFLEDEPIDASVHQRAV